METVTLLCDANAVWAIGIVAGLTASLINTLVVGALFFKAQFVDPHKHSTRVRKPRKAKAPSRAKNLREGTKSSAHSQVTPVKAVSTAVTRAIKM